jgi:hypothetical protein
MSTFCTVVDNPDGSVHGKMMPDTHGDPMRATFLHGVNDIRVDQRRVHAIDEVLTPPPGQQTDGLRCRGKPVCCWDCKLMDDFGND